MSVVKTIAGMDLDKINMDLVESLLEWIVEGKHNYPRGKEHPHTVYSQLWRSATVLLWIFATLAHLL